jgi:hypothetical protein
MTSPQFQMSSPGLSGRSSIPETAVLEQIGRGVLDHPLSRVMTTEKGLPSVHQDVSSHSRHALRPSRASVVSLQNNRGRRECRVRASPIARQQTKKLAAVTTGSAGSSGIPCAMVLTLIARSPRGPGFLAPVVARSSHATWPQRREARTTRLRRPHRDQSSAQSLRADPMRPSHPAFNVRDDREAPLV